MQNKKAFSFIEIIIVIAIITLLAIVGFQMQDSSTQKTQNAKAEGDIGTLNNSFASYLEQEGTLPNPKGNINYFGSGSEYVHVDSGFENDISISYGKHGFVTENILPKQYLNYLPLDPRTNQYYAYGKTTDSKYYEVAGVLKINGDNTAKVSGNYSGEDGPYNLIKEYNGPDFVTDNSTLSFPYNPDERLLTAKVDNFSAGLVTISNSDFGYTINDQNQILEHTLVKGDTITVNAGGEATLYYSDGSQSTLGDSSSSSVLNLTNMEYPGEDNLITRIQLALSSGTIWTKATSLDTNSEFEIYTQDTAASIRGTIFGVKTNAGNTIVSVEKGEVEVKRIPYGTNVIDSIQNGTIQDNLEIITGSIPPNGVIGEGITIDKNGTTITDTNLIPKNNTSEKLNSTDQIQFEEIDINTETGSGKISFKIHEKHKSADIVLIKTGSNFYKTSLSNVQISGNILTFSGGTTFKQLELSQASGEGNENDTNPLKGINILEDHGVFGEIDLSGIIKNNGGTSQKTIRVSLCKAENGKIKCIASKQFGTDKGALNYKRIDKSNKTLALADTAFNGGNNIDPVAKTVPEASNSCAANPGYGNANYYEGEATVANQIWVKSSPPTPCSYTCKTGFEGQYCETNTITGCEVNGIPIQLSTYKWLYTSNTSANCESIREKVYCSPEGITSPTVDSTYQYGNCSPTTPTQCLATTTVEGYTLSNTDLGVKTGFIKNNTINDLYIYGTSTKSGEKYNEAEYECRDIGGNHEFVLKAERPILNCNNGHSEFKIGTENYCEPKIDGKELYAFAPYDDRGTWNSKDLLKIYNTNGTPLSGVNVSQNSLTYTCSGDRGGKYPNTEQCSFFPANSGWKNMFGFLNPNDHSGTIAYGGLITFTNGTEEVSIGVDNSFFDYTIGSHNTKGIYLDNRAGFGARDYVKYNGISLGDNFTIEMSVRGKELNRTSGSYYLFHINGNERIYLSNGVFYLKADSAIYNGIDKIILNNTSFDDNSFYSIKYVRNGYNLKIKINGVTTEINNYSGGVPNYVYVGSRNGYNYQWNGLIDYIKFYK